MKVCFFIRNYEFVVANYAYWKTYPYGIVHITATFFTLPKNQNISDLFLFSTKHPPLFMFCLSLWKHGTHWLYNILRMKKGLLSPTSKISGVIMFCLPKDSNLLHILLRTLNLSLERKINLSTKRNCFKNVLSIPWYLMSTGSLIIISMA